MTTLPFAVLDPNKITEIGPSLAVFPPAVIITPAFGTSTWIPVSGFTGGTAAISEAYGFGSLVKYSTNVTSATAAAGANTATLALPVARVGNAPFLAARDLYGSVAALTSGGVLLTGRIEAVPGTLNALVTLDNSSGASRLLDQGLQVMMTYHLV